MKAHLPLALLFSVLLAACTGGGRAPVTDRATGTIGAPPAAKPAPQAAKPAPPAAKPPAATADASPETHTVRRGETLYGIALDNGQDYRDLAEWNALSDPNLIREGQVLRLKPPAGVQTRPVAGIAAPAAQPLGAPNDLVKTEPRALRLPYSEENLAMLTRPGAAARPAAEPPKPEAVKPAPAKPEAAKPAPARPEASGADGDDEKIDWGWPAGGRVIAGFSDPANKGVDIAGKKGESVFASAGGKVVYIGEGLRGYGKLVIIKHNNTYLTAYAHNDTIAVKEQQTVAKGQKIAEIGSTGSDTTKLHFEIRRSGKPVDPMKYLPPRP